MAALLLNHIKPRGIPWGGVINTIAVHPADANTIFIGSPTGGLYRSCNGGEHWEHLYDAGPLRIAMVSYCPSDPNIMLVTTGLRYEDTQNRWHLAQHRWWEHLDTAGGSIPPITSRWPELVNASGISWVPGSNTVWVATDYGLMRSHDHGERWSVPITVDPGAAGFPDIWDPRFVPDRLFAVLALDENHVVTAAEAASIITATALGSKALVLHLTCTVSVA